MPITDDWQVNYVPAVTNGYKEIIHIDGILSYGSNTGTAPALNDYVYQAATGALGRVIAGSDLGGVSATGTLTLTNVRGRFDGSSALTVLTAVNFDTVANGGFKIGDTITGPTTESLDVLAIEYNSGPKVVADAGEGWAYGNNLTTGWANNEQIDVSGGATAVALVHTGAEDTAATFTGAVATATLAPPGTVETNYSLIIHYDAGTIAIPEGATVSDQTTGAEGLVEQVLGVTATGSLRLVDTSLTPAWTDNNNIDGEEVVFFNAQVAGQVFIENGLYEGQTSGARFQVLAAGIIDDGDSTGKLWTNGVSAALTLNEDIHRILPGDVLGSKVAQVEQVSTTLPTVAVVNVPDGVRTEQRADAGIDQGGIYARTVSLNIRRDSNRFFTWYKGVFSGDINQLDDKPAINGNVRDSLYTVLAANDWQIPDLSFRFLEKGSWQDDGLNNRWTNYQADASIFTGADITNEGYARTATKPRPMPDAYCEQIPNEALDQFWLEGPFSVIIKTKSTTDMASIDPATPAVGQLINSGEVTWHSRPFGRFYSWFDNTQVGIQTPVVLDNKDDAQNNTGQYRAAFSTGGAGAYTVGEEIATADGTKRGIVTASDTGTTGNVDYILLTDTQFVNTDVVVGEVSAKSATFAAPSNLVAGYGTDIRTMVVDRRFTGGSTTVASFIVGEQISQAVSGYDGYVLEDDGGTIYVQDAPGTAAPDATNQLSGDTSGALNTPTGVADFTTAPKDLEEGSGDNNYAGVTSANITGGSPQTISAVYEWDKFLANEKYKTTLLQGGRGSAAGVQGRFYRGFDSTFSEIKSAPYGTKPGSIMQGAEGHFIDKDTLVAADLQNIRVTPIGGSELTPPNLQTAQLTNLQSGWNGGLYRSTGAGSKDILVTEFQVGAGNAAGNSTIVLQAGDRTVSPTPADVPSSGGVVKCEDPNNPGIYLRFPYSSVNRSTNTYTLTSGTIGDVTGGSALTQGDNAFVAIKEDAAAGATLSNTMQFIGTVEMVGIARKKGFDDYDSAQQFTATGVNFAVNRSADGVVNLP